jgi:hypothetical protein
MTLLVKHGYPLVPSLRAREQASALKEELVARVVASTTDVIIFSWPHMLLQLLGLRHVRWKSWLSSTFLELPTASLLTRKLLFT